MKMKKFWLGGRVLVSLPRSTTAFLYFWPKFLIGFLAGWFDYGSGEHVETFSLILIFDMFHLMFAIVLQMTAVAPPWKLKSRCPHTCMAFVDAFLNWCNELSMDDINSRYIETFQ